MQYSFPPLLLGTLVGRYKRFFAEVALDTGEIVTCHCANTGPMHGVCSLGAPVAVQHVTGKGRKLDYSWELIYVDDTWVGVNTALPNRVVGQGLAEHLFPELSGYTQIQREVAYGQEKSRIDFLLTGEKPSYVEVKNTTWTTLTPEGRRALFPDTVTTRGQKHLRELTALVQGGVAAALIYFINRGDCHSFSPGSEADPVYGQLLRAAVSAGVQILPYRFIPSPTGLTFGGLVPLILD